MDAGLAGLIGALGGGLIGAGGAWGAALIAFRGARYQADTQAKSAREQWLRQIRRETCALFITRARRGLDGPFKVVCTEDLRSMSAEQFSALETQCAASVAEIEEALSVLQLEAPDLVMLSGTAFTSWARALLRELRRGTQDRGSLNLHELERCYNEAKDNLQIALTRSRRALEET